MRILCLHGFSQSSEIFRKRLKVLEKSISATLVFPDGPHILKQENEILERCWWRSSDDRLVYHGLQESIEFIQSLWNSQEFDGILGFSQGATFASILSPILIPKFMIVVSGFLPFPKTLADSILNDKTQSLHIMGKSDEIVPMDESIELSQRFINPIMYIHDGGYVSIILNVDIIYQLTVIH